MANSVDDTYGTREGSDFAVAMAKAVLGKGTKMPSAAMAMLPGTWMYSIPDLIEAIGGTQYRDIGLTQDKALKERQLNPGYKTPSNYQYGRPISQPAMNNPSGDKMNLGGEVYKSFVDKGLPPHQAAAVAGNMAWESGGKVDAVSPNDNLKNSPNSPHSAGIAQWNDRLPALIAFAKDQGIDISNGNLKDVNYVRKVIKEIPLKTQIDFAHEEMQGAENKSFNNITNATDVRGATGGAIGYHRPAGYTPNNPEAGHGFPARLNLANKILEANKDYKTASAQLEPGTNNMGGGGRELSEVPGIQVAQAAPYTSTPVQTPAVSSQVQSNNPPGYTGAIPPAPPLASTKQLRARVMAAPNNQVQGIIDNYEKSAAGRAIDVPGGTLHQNPQPGGQPPINTFTQSPKVEHLTPDSVPIQRGMTEDGKPYFELMLPGMQGHKFSSQSGAFKAYEDYIDFTQKMKAQGAATSELAKGRTGHILEAQEEGSKAIEAGRTVNQMLGISKSDTGKGMPSGPTKDFMIRAGQLIDSLSPVGSTKFGGLPEAEQYEKLQTFLSSQAAHAFSTRGTNFSFESFLKATPGLINTKPGRELMLDVIHQDMQTKAGLGILASKFSGKNVQDWQQAKQEYYDKHPIVVTLPTNGKTVVMKKVTKEERDALPAGMGYLDPNGDVRYRK